MFFACGPQVNPAVPIQQTDGFPIGQQPTATCAHDYVFLRTDRPGKTAYERAGASDVDTFYCRHCLEYRTVERKA